MNVLSIGNELFSILITEHPLVPRLSLLRFYCTIEMGWKLLSVLWHSIEGSGTIIMTMISIHTLTLINIFGMLCVMLTEYNVRKPHSLATYSILCKPSCTAKAKGALLHSVMSTDLIQTSQFTFTASYLSIGFCSAAICSVVHLVHLTRIASIKYNMECAY